MAISMYVCRLADQHVYQNLQCFPYYIYLTRHTSGIMVEICWKYGAFTGIRQYLDHIYTFVPAGTLYNLKHINILNK